MKGKAFGAILLLCIPRMSPAQSVELTWDAVTEDIQNQPESIKGYYVAYGQNASGPYPSGFSTTNTTQTRVDNLQGGQTYYFVVQAIDQSDNRSAWSNEVAYTPPVETCTPGDSRICSKNEGECTEGQQLCEAGGVWGLCDGAMPTQESCDQKDNDCDGQTDEDGICGTDGGQDPGSPTGGCSCASDPTGALSLLGLLLLLAGWRRR